MVLKLVGMLARTQVGTMAQQKALSTVERTVQWKVAMMDGSMADQLASELVLRMEKLKVDSRADLMVDLKGD